MLIPSSVLVTPLLVALPMQARHAAVALCSPHAALFEWADANGAVRCVQIGPSKFGGLGLVATKSVAAGAELLRIPLELSVGVPRDEQNTWAMRLAMRLHNGERKRYSRALPAAPNVLHRWTASQLAQLQNATLVDEAARWRNTRREHHELAQTIAPIDEPSFNEIYDCVAARTFGARGEQDTLRLVPLISMAQHSCTTGGQFALRGDAVCLLSGRALAAGDEVFLDYGARTSDEFALQYGFVPDRNKHDAATVPLDTGGEVAQVRWEDADDAPSDVRDACTALLASLPSTLAADIDELRAAESEGAEEATLIALRYRVAKKQLLTAVAGVPAVSEATSAFARMCE